MIILNDQSNLETNDQSSQIPIDQSPPNFCMIRDLYFANLDKPKLVNRISTDFQTITIPPGPVELIDLNFRSIH